MVKRQEQGPSFQKFTDRARKVLTLAQGEAQRFDQDYIGTEHLLLGLVREGEGVAATVLENLNVELPKVRTAVEFIIGRGDRPVTNEVGLTPRAKRVIELAIDEARSLGHDYIGTEHLLLGLVREGEGIAAGVLESLGVNLDKVRHEVVRVLSKEGSAGPGGGTTHVFSTPARATGQSQRRRTGSGSPYEASIGFSRAIRVGNRVIVSGTAPIWPDGHVDPDPAVQTRRCLEIIGEALAALDAALAHVVRTRMFILDPTDAENIGRVHGEFFGSIRPAATMVVVAALLDPRWKVEIEAEALIDD